MRYTLRGARLLDAQTDRTGDLTVAGATFAQTGGKAKEPGHSIDARHLIALPGFIDIHTHGGGGYNLHTTDAEEIRAYARWVPATGVTGFLIGVVGIPGAPPLLQLQAGVDAIAQAGAGAMPLGIHLEGPYINERRRGAHLPAWLRAPSAAEAEGLLAITGDRLTLVTLAPELPGASEMIRRLLDAGVRVSMGHTDATYEQAQAAIALGITHATHCCNAMRPIHHRDPGPLGAFAESEHVMGEVIADGVHVHPAMLLMLLRILGPRRAIVITDALAAAGTGPEDAAFEFAGQPARVIDGAARLADGTITGSVLTMDAALRNVLRLPGVTPSEAVGMLTYNPARAASVADRKGLLQPGYDADFVLCDADFTVQATICGGRLAYVAPAWRDRLAALDGAFSAPVTPAASSLAGA